MGITTAIANGLKAVAAVFGFARQRDAENNSPEMQANAAAKTDEKVDKIVSDAIEQGNAGNLDEERKLASE